MKRCKWFGHKWVPVYTGGIGFNFIGTYCSRCGFGNQELMDFVKGIKPYYCTYSEEYWKQKHEPPKIEVEF